MIYPAISYISSVSFVSTGRFTQFNLNRSYAIEVSSSATVSILTEKITPSNAQKSQATVYKDVHFIRGITRENCKCFVLSPCLYVFGLKSIFWWLKISVEYNHSILSYYKSNRLSLRYITVVSWFGQKKNNLVSQWKLFDIIVIHLIEIKGEWTTSLYFAYTEFKTVGDEYFIHGQAWISYNINVSTILLS